MKLDVEQAHLEEFNGFNKVWDDKMKDFEEKAKMEQSIIETKHKEKFEESTAALQSKLAEKAKPSAEILNLKKIQVNLAKQKE